MATFKLVLSSYVKQNGLQSIDLRITINRKPKPTPTGFYVQAKQWDAKRERVKPSHPNFTEINDALESKVEDAVKAYAQMNNKKKPTSKDVAKAMNATHDFYEFADSVIQELRDSEKHPAADKKQSHISNLKKFAKDLAIEDITPDFISNYKKWFKVNGNDKKGVKSNTVVTNLATIRAMYNLSPYKASPSPFESVKVGSYKASGDIPLSVDDIEKIWNYIAVGKWSKIARNSFLFSFYALGMRSGDVLTIEWSEIGKNEIIYMPDKTSESTGQKNYVPMHERLRKLIDELPETGKTIYGLIETADLKEIDRLKGNIQTQINKELRFIAQRVGITKPIKFKLARTTFADIANKKTGRNIYGIQQAMGHGKIATTEIYLGDDWTAIDEISKAVYGA